MKKYPDVHYDSCVKVKIGVPLANHFPASLIRYLRHCFDNQFFVIDFFGTMSNEILRSILYIVKFFDATQKKRQSRSRADKKELF
jgi:hypothetical protein